MNTTRNTTKPRPARRGAFTLTEMLVVIFVLAILLALVVRVNRWMMERAGIKRTEAAMSVLLDACRAYNDSQRKYPGSLAALRSIPSINAKLNGLPKGIASGSMFNDGFGNPMRYFVDKGIGNTPVIISNGPDAKQDTADDIRSDRL